MSGKIGKLNKDRQSVSYNPSTTFSAILPTYKQTKRQRNKQIKHSQ